MKKNVLTVVTSILGVILFIAIIIGAIIHFSLGKEGVITKATQDEETFNQTEVLEELNLAIAEKYVATYKNEVVNGKKIEEFFNKETAINYLKEKNIIEEYNEKENTYFVKIENLKGDINQGKGKNGSDKDVYIIEKSSKTDDYVVYYLKNSDEKVNIGNLEFEP